MPYLPFLDDPGHIRALEGQRFVVLRPAILSSTYQHIQKALRRRLRGQLISYPARAHVTLCSFAPATPVKVIRDLVRACAVQLPPIELEVVGVSAFPPPFKALIINISKRPILTTAMNALRCEARRKSLTVDETIPVDNWAFHMSLAYCRQLDDVGWQGVAEFSKTLAVSRAREVLDCVEVVAYDQGKEYTGGTFQLSGSSSPVDSNDAV